MALIPFKRVVKEVLVYLPFTGISTLLQKHCNKKQETEECTLKLYGYIYHQGTYTPLWGARELP